MGMIAAIDEALLQARLRLQVPVKICIPSGIEQEIAVCHYGVGRARRGEGVIPSTYMGIPVEHVSSKPHVLTKEGERLPVKISGGA